MHPADRPIPELSDRYRITREIGRGGMATVYLAEDLRHDRLVAVKVLRADLGGSLQPERFLREIRIAAQLQHPNILGLFDSGESAGLLYYVMPYVEGESLGARLAREGPLTLEDTIAIARDVADALTYAHAHDVVHRDIKPENILLTGGRAVVADFGIARALAVTGGVTITASGLAVGTPGYMSPEQATGERVDARTDIYALGCVVYEMLIGAQPFTGHSAQAIMARHLVDAVPPLRTVRPGIPAAAEAAVIKALAKEPADRFATPRQFVAALAERGTTTQAPVKSVLVLPFRNLSPEPDGEYLGDALTDELIGDLSKIKALRVISRTSAMRLKDSPKPLAAIAEELGLRFIIEGTVRRSASAIRVTVQLTDAHTDACIWADKYHAAPADVLDMQEGVSRAVVEALKVRLSPVEDSRVARRPLENVHAYESYLRARQEIWRFTPDSLARARELIGSALTLVGDNALLFATLGHINVNFVVGGLSADPSYLARAAEYAAKAVQLDPESHYGLWLRGYVRFVQGDLPHAAADLKRSLEIDPNDPDALISLGYLYSLAGRMELAAPLFARLIEVDPLTPLNHSMPGFMAMMEGRFDEGIGAYRRFRQLDPEGVWATYFLGWIVSFTGRVDEATAILEQLGNDPAVNPAVATGIMLKHALRGEREAAEAAGTPALLGAAEGNEMFSRGLAEVYALVGDTENALRWLANANRLGLMNYPFLATHDRLLDNLRGNPRFQQLLMRVKLQWELVRL